jgi:urease subunit gamma
VHDDLHANCSPEAREAVAAEARLPTAKWEEEVARGLEMVPPHAQAIPSVFRSGQAL